MSTGGGLASLQQSHKLQSIFLGTTTAFTGGQRNKQLQIQSGLRTFAMLVTLTATLTLAGGPVTKILNGGKLRAVFQYLGMIEASDPVWYGDARAMGRISDLAGAGMSPNIDLVAVANGTYALRDQVVIYAAWPDSVNPQETAWREKSTLQQTYIFGDLLGALGANPALFNVANVLVETPGTATIASLTMTATQFADDQTQILSYYRPRYRTIVFNPSGVMANTPAKWDQSLPVRHALFAQDSVRGWVTDAVTSLQLLYDGGQIIGQTGPLPFAELVNKMYLRYGGALDMTQILQIIAANAGTSGNWTPAQGPSLASFADLSNYLIDFQSGGKLSQILRPDLIGPNLRYILAGPGTSTLPGAGQIGIATTICELEDASNSPNLGAILNPVKPWQRIRAAAIAAQSRS